MKVGAVGQAGQRDTLALAGYAAKDLRIPLLNRRDVCLRRIEMNVIHADGPG